LGWLIPKLVGQDAKIWTYYAGYVPIVGALPLISTPSIIHDESHCGPSQKRYGSHFYPGMVGEHCNKLFKTNRCPGHTWVCPKMESTLYPISWLLQWKKSDKPWDVFPRKLAEKLHLLGIFHHLLTQKRSLWKSQSIKIQLPNIPFMYALKGLVRNMKKIPALIY